MLEENIVTPINKAYVESLVKELPLQKSVELWDMFEYGNVSQMVMYNLSIDNSLNSNEDNSTFYLVNFSEMINTWQEDKLTSWPYTIDFSNPNWDKELVLAAKSAYKRLCLQESA